MTKCFGISLEYQKRKIYILRRDYKANLGKIIFRPGYIGGNRSDTAQKMLPQKNTWMYWW
jgi:hypothetical protein